MERVEIRWYIVPNANEVRKGWMPVYDINGKRQGNEYGKGWSRDEALYLAEAMARQEAERYVGEWEVSWAPKGPAFDANIKCVQMYSKPHATVRNLGQALEHCHDCAMLALDSQPWLPTAKDMPSKPCDARSLRRR